MKNQKLFSILVFSFYAAIAFFAIISSFSSFNAGHITLLVFSLSLAAASLVLIILNIKNNSLKKPRNLITFIGSIVLTAFYFLSLVFVIAYYSLVHSQSSAGSEVLNALVNSTYLFNNFANILLGAIVIIWLDNMLASLKTKAEVSEPTVVETSTTTTSKPAEVKTTNKEKASTQATQPTQPTQPTTKTKK
ncbi:MAG: hypothetical protein LBV55_01190 [Acholeplasmatales bacterium]|jgi:hypothetical protein|nr:hypothetical protein [Acholeplasmatales bacterium]